MKNTQNEPEATALQMPGVIHAVYFDRSDYSGWWQIHNGAPAEAARWWSKRFGWLPLARVNVRFQSRFRSAKAANAEIARMGGIKS